MKKFFQVCTTIKEVTALCYTAAMCFYLFFQWVFKQETAPLSILFSLLLVCIAAGTMQRLATTTSPLDRVSRSRPPRSGRRDFTWSKFTMADLHAVLAAAKGGVL